MGKINRRNTMAENRWRLQVLRADGTVEREQLFVNEDVAFRAFDALAPSIPKRLQVRAAGKARYVTIESEGCASGPYVEVDGRPTVAVDVEDRHTFRASPNWSDVCDVCGENKAHENHGAS